MRALAGLLVLPCLVGVSGGFVPADRSLAVHQAQIDRVQAKPADSATTVGLAPANEPIAAAPASAPAEEQSAESGKPNASADADRDKTIADAAALRARYRDYRTGKSKQAVPLYEFRTMEQRLNRLTDADPNIIAENVGAMRMIQGEILGPAVQRSMIVKRKLFAYQAGSNPGMNVSVEGPGNTTVRFVSPGLTRQVVMKLDEDSKIFAQLRMLDFRSAVFSDGRRNRYTYNVAQGRLR